jgi:peptidoglycan/LPS O-acetylase OafA/YrhL
MTGGVIMHLALLLPRHVWSDTLLLILAVALSLAAAWVLHLHVERRCQTWSSRIKYRKMAKEKPQPKG